MRDRDFNHFRDEAGWFLRKLGLPVVTRVLKLQSKKDKMILFPVEENIYLVDEEKRIVYTNDESVKDMVCYFSPFGKEPVCFPKKSTIATDPKKFKGKPLDRNAKEEGIIAAEELMDDDTALGHFAYYCVTRGGVPVVGNDEDGGTVMVCLGGKVNGYSVKIGMVNDGTSVIKKVFKNPERALTIFYLGGEEGEAFGKLKKTIVPQVTAQKAGVVFSVE